MIYVWAGKTSRYNGSRFGLVIVQVHSYICIVAPAGMRQALANHESEHVYVRVHAPMCVRVWVCVWGSLGCGGWVDVFRVYMRIEKVHGRKFLKKVQSAVS